MQILDNLKATVKNDLKVCLGRDSKLSIAMACFLCELRRNRGTKSSAMNDDMLVQAMTTRPSDVAKQICCI